MLTEHFRILEGEFLQFFGVDLLDFGGGRFRYRRLAVLLDALPDSSRFRELLARDAPRSPRNDEEEERLWHLEHYLLAQIVDLLAAANWQRGGKGSRPKPLPRPGVKGATENVIKRKPRLTRSQKIEALARVAPKGSKIGAAGG